MSKTAAIYTRVSTEEQTENYSLPTQLEGCQQYAAQQGFEVVGQFSDSHTGTTLDRPELNRLRKLAGTIDAVIVYCQDRLGRAEALDTWNLIAELDSKGTQVHCADNGLVDIRSFFGQLEMLFRAKSAQDESKKIGERSQRGKKARARAGKVTISTVAPYGYDYDSEAGMLVINEEQARIVRLVYQWYVHGDDMGKKLGGYKIARRLTEMSVPTKHDIEGYRKSKKGYGVWGRSSIMKILRQETYCGTWYYNCRATGKSRTQRVWKDETEWIPVDVPAIVSRELWEAAQAQGVSNSNHSKRNTKRQYLMQGRLFCATCGYQFRCRSDYRHREDGIGYYPCHGQESHHSADYKSPTCHRALKQLDVDGAVWQAIASILQEPNVVLQAMKQRQIEMEKQLQPDREYLKRCRSLQSKLDSRRERLLKLYLDGTYEQDWLDKELAVLDKEGKELDKKIRDLEERCAAVEIGRQQTEQIRAFCESAREGIEQFSFEDKRMVLETLDIKGIVHRGETPPEDVILLSGYIPLLEITGEAETEGAAWNAPSLAGEFETTPS